MKDKPTLKTMILGLDGATFDVMLPFIKEKKLPTLAYLLENGAWGELESTIPPVTAAAWPSFMTGENPGKHGILDFMKATIGRKSRSGCIKMTVLYDWRFRTEGWVFLNRNNFIYLINIIEPTPNIMQIKEVRDWD